MKTNLSLSETESLLIQTVAEELENAHLISRETSDLTDDLTSEDVARTEVLQKNQNHVSPLFHSSATVASRFPRIINTYSLLVGNTAGLQDAGDLEAGIMANKVSSGLLDVLSRLGSGGHSIQPIHGDDTSNNALDLQFVSNVRIGRLNTGS